MSTLLYVERETNPNLIAGDEVTIFSRSKGTPGAPPRLFVVALASGTQFSTAFGQGPQVDNFTFTPSAVLENGQRSEVDLASAVTADSNIYVLRCLSGRLAVTVVSPQEVQMQFRGLGRRR